jgi:hypothetical protein
MADVGYKALQYHGIPVMFDGVSGMPASHMYMLNTNYFEVVVHEAAQMTVMDEVKPYNQDSVIVPVLWMGNTCIKNRSLQAVIKA